MLHTDLAIELVVDGMAVDDCQSIELLDLKFHEASAALLRARGGRRGGEFHVTIEWTPGHRGISECEKCAKKDRVITQLREALDGRDEIIDRLQEEVRELRADR